MRRRAVLIGAPALVAGCSNPFSQPFPEKRFFVLEARRPERLPPNPRGRVLLLRAVTATPGTELRGIVTRLGGGQQKVDFWSEFFAPPAALVQDQLRTWLADCGLFSAVVDPGTRTAPSLALETALTALFADAAESPPTARVGMRSLLLGLDRSPPRVLSDGAHDRRAQIASLDPAVIVAGLNLALAAVFSEIEASLRRAA